MKRRTGFTLIEMMIVVAIIAILFTILLTQLGKAKKTSQIAALREGVSTFRNEAQTYARTQNDSYEHLCDDGTKPYGYLMQVIRRVRPSAADLQSEGVSCKANVESYAVDINSLLGAIEPGQTLCVDGTGYSGAGSVDTSGQFITCTQ